MKQKKVRLPRLSRRGKLLCNLGTAVFLVLVSWVLLGCPAWTEAGALHRLERTLLLEPGTVRCRDDGVWWRDDTTVLVTGENYAYKAGTSTAHLFWHEAGYPTEYAALDGGGRCCFGGRRESRMDRWSRGPGCAPTRRRGPSGQS